MPQINTDDFEEILDESIRDLSIDLDMSELGAAMNQMLHICYRFTEIDPHALSLLLRAYADHALDQLDTDRLGQTIVSAMTSLQFALDCKEGRFTPN